MSGVTLKQVTAFLAVAEAGSFTHAGDALHLGFPERDVGAGAEDDRAAQQHEGIGQPVWFGFWLANIGVFIGGCLACWAVDAMSKPRSVVPPQQYPNHA